MSTVPWSRCCIALCALVSTSVATALETVISWHLKGQLSVVCNGVSYQSNPPSWPVQTSQIAWNVDNSAGQGAAATGPLLALGVAEPCPYAAAPFDIVCKHYVQPVVMSSTDGGVTWGCLTDRAFAVSRFHAMVLSYTSPDPTSDCSMVCIIGGQDARPGLQKPDFGRGLTNVTCTQDGIDWWEAAPLPTAVVAGTVSQFGRKVLLVGGLRSDNSDTSLVGTVDDEACTITGWGTTDSPVGPGVVGLWSARFPALTARPGNPGGDANAESEAEGIGSREVVFVGAGMSMKDVTPGMRYTPDNFTMLALQFLENGRQVAYSTDWGNLWRTVSTPLPRPTRTGPGSSFAHAVGGNLTANNSLATVPWGSTRILYAVQGMESHISMDDGQSWNIITHRLLYQLDPPVWYPQQTTPGWGTDFTGTIVPSMAWGPDSRVFIGDPWANPGDGGNRGTGPIDPTDSSTSDLARAVALTPPRPVFQVWDTFTSALWVGYVDNCPTTCGAGQYLQGSCMTGPYSARCRQCMSCGPGFFEIQACGGSSNAQCQACTSCIRYQSECNATHDAVCKAPSVDPGPQPSSSPGPDTSTNDRPTAPRGTAQASVGETALYSIIATVWLLAAAIGSLLGGGKASLCGRDRTRKLRVGEGQDGAKAHGQGKEPSAWSAGGLVLAIGHASCLAYVLVDAWLATTAVRMQAGTAQTAVALCTMAGCLLLGASIALNMVWLGRQDKKKGRRRGKTGRMEERACGGVPLTRAQLLKLVYGAHHAPAAWYGGLEVGPWPWRAPKPATCLSLPSSLQSKKASLAPGGPAVDAHVITLAQAYDAVQASSGGASGRASGSTGPADAGSIGLPKSPSCASGPLDLERSPAARTTLSAGQAVPGRVGQPVPRPLRLLIGYLLGDVGHAILLAVSASVLRSSADDVPTVTLLAPLAAVLCFSCSSVLAVRLYWSPVSHSDGDGDEAGEGQEDDIAEWGGSGSTMSPLRRTLTLASLPSPHSGTGGSFVDLGQGSIPSVVLAMPMAVPVPVPMPVHHLGRGARSTGLSSVTVDPLQGRDTEGDTVTVAHGLGGQDGQSHDSTSDGADAELRSVAGLTMLPSVHPALSTSLFGLASMLRAQQSARRQQEGPGEDGRDCGEPSRGPVQGTSEAGHSNGSGSSTDARRGQEHGAGHQAGGRAGLSATSAVSTAAPGEDRHDPEPEGASIYSGAGPAM